MTTLTTTRYERKERESLLNLLFYSRRAHTHLDWYRTAHWLDLPGVHVRLAWQRGELAGMMGISPALHETAWIRVAAIQNFQPTASVLRALWQDLQADLQAGGIKQVAVLVINNWLLDYLPQLNFYHQEQVVTLFRSSTGLPPVRANSLLIREAYFEDVPALLQIDHAAFGPPWQMQVDELRQAIRYAASVTIALLDSQMVGYQISTRHHTSGHLARLGVMPRVQGQGIGAALLDELLARFLRRGVRSMTVNTQESNVQSIRLYTRYEFRRNGYDLPVWQADVAPGA